MTLSAAQSSQTVYHLQTAPGDLAPFILTSGSTHRIRRLATFFDDVRLERPNREFLTITGTYKNIPVTGLATGIGAPPTVIAIVEALQCQQQATFIRLGSCGSLQPYIQIGDLIISNKALRREFVTQFYAPPEIEATADPEITARLNYGRQTVGDQLLHRPHLYCRRFLPCPRPAGTRFFRPGPLFYFSAPGSECPQYGNGNGSIFYFGTSLRLSNSGWRLCHGLC